MDDFVDIISEEGGIALSVGCGSGTLETGRLNGIFDEIYGLDIREDRVAEAQERGLEVVQASVPPLPFDSDSLDAVISVGTVEHLPDERGFFEEARRCLKPDGNIYITMPIEVGIGGLLRFWGRCAIHPTLRDTSNSWKQFFEFTKEELCRKTPRDKHGVRHRYYNYTYSIGDLKELFEDVELQPWPISFTRSVNLIYMAKATAPA